jgi:hypothetical protein
MTKERTRSASGLLLASIAAFNVGCYAAIPISGESLRIGRSVSAELTDAGTAEMASQVGPRIRSLFGDVNGATDETLVLALRSATDYRGIESFWNGEHVTVPRADIAHISERRLSRSRTALITAGLLAGLYVAGRGFGLFSGGNDHRGDLPVSQ